MKTTEEVINSEAFKELFTYNKLGIPLVKGCNDIPNYLVEYRWPKEHPPNSCTHFYLDDYKINSCWRQKERSLTHFKNTKFMLTPDFSLYIDMPYTEQLWNTYRQRYLGAMWGLQGYRVIPNITWSTPVSYEFCFEGVAKGGIVAFSARSFVGDLEPLFWQGYKALLERVKPEFMLCYCQSKRVQDKIKETNIKFYPDKWVFARVTHPYLFGEEQFKLFEKE
jgi:hypothetical protein